MSNNVWREKVLLGLLPEDLNQELFECYPFGNKDKIADIGWPSLHYKLLIERMCLELVQRFSLSELLSAYKDGYSASDP